jgi:hypothetical protein
MPSGATIIGNPLNDTITVQFSNFTSGNITVMAVNNCGSTPLRSLAVSAGTLPAPTAIFGPTNVCNFIGGSAVNYSTQAVAGITNYIWTVPAGATIQSGQGTTSILVLFQSGFSGGQLTLAHSNGCAISPTRALNLISSQSTTVGAISGPTAVCSFTGGSAASLSYTWSAPNGSTITNNGSNTVQIAYPNGFTSGTVSVTVTFGCGSPAVRTINVSALPQAATIVGPTCITPGQANTYTINGGVGATTFTWSLSGNASIVSGQGTSTVTINFAMNYTTGTLSVLPSSSCGSAPVDTQSIGIAPVIPTTIFGPATLCPGDTVSYYINSYSGVDYLIWSFPSGMVILNGNTSDTVRAIVNPSFGGGNMSVMTVNGCGSSPMLYRALTRCPTALLAETSETATPDDNKTENGINDSGFNEANVIETTNDNINFVLYPNPGSGEIQINISGGQSENYNVIIRNGLGQIVYEAKLKSQDKMNLEHLIPGLYFVNALGEDGISMTKRLIIK